MHVENSTIVVGGGVNEHTRAAVEAIAHAVEANAQALIAAAKALQPSSGPSYGIYVAAPLKDDGHE